MGGDPTDVLHQKNGEEHETNHTEDMTEVLFNRIWKQRNEKTVFVEKRGDLKGIVGT